MKNRLVLPVVLVLLGTIGLSFGTALGAEKPQQDIGALIKAMSERLETQDRKIALLEGKLTDEALQAARHEEIAKIMSDMRADAGQRTALPKWLDNLKFYGDLRLRYEHHAADGTQMRERNRYRFRLRFGFTKKWLDDQMEVGFRLASGSNADGQSTNQTFDNAFNKKQIWIDRAYAKYSPNMLPGLTLIAGKIPNILEHTDLVFDSDINPEGAAAAYQHAIAGIDVFGKFAHLVVNETRDTHDTILNVYQGGIHTPLPFGAKATIAAAWYDFENYEDSPVGGNNWARNTKMINVLAKVKLNTFDIPWQVYFDWVHNTAENDQTPGLENAADGYAFGVKFGRNKKQGDWSIGYQFKYIEENATPSGLNDSDFGGTDLRGHVIKSKYNLTDFLTAGGSFFITRPIAGEAERNDFLMQLDLVWKF